MPFSAKVGFFASGGSAWTPSEVSPEIWVKAEASELTLSGTDVTAWTNKGSGGTDFSQATGSKQPTWDSANGWVLFDGADDVLEANSLQGFSTGAPAITTVAVVNVEDYDGQFGGVAGKYFQIYGDPSGGTGGVYSIATGSGSVGWNTRHNDGATSWGNGVLDADKITSLQCAVNEQYQNYQFYLDGDDLGAGNSISGSGSDINFNTGSAAYSYLGGGPGGNPSQFMYSNIKIYELVSLEADSEDTRQKLEGYMAWEHGLEGNLPAGHPYKNAAPTT